METGARTDSLPAKQSEVGMDRGVLCSLPRDDAKYPQDGRKMCVIIFVKEVIASLGLKVDDHQIKQRQRNKDVIKMTFEELGYECPVIENQVTRKDIVDQLTKYKQELEDSSHFICWLLTYRAEDENGHRLYASDRTISLKDITKSFLGNICKPLAGKPKLFFIDSVYVECKKDPHLAHRLDKEQKQDAYLIPTTADFLIGLSPFVQSETKYAEVVCDAVKDHVKGSLGDDFTTALDVIANKLVRDDVTSTYISTLRKTFSLSPQ
ncbi:caspase-3-like isoform X2 [Ornithodoros turicata]|uniref:caspase-3-like isoform X2 n=1 Tax=Ornithodoros turicata TaxID=34597 RepID=UPI003138659A